LAVVEDDVVSNADHSAGSCALLGRVRAFCIAYPLACFSGLSQSRNSYARISVQNGGIDESPVWTSCRARGCRWLPACQRGGGCGHLRRCRTCGLLCWRAAGFARRADAALICSNAGLPAEADLCRPGMSLLA